MPRVGINTRIGTPFRSGGGWTPQKLIATVISDTAINLTWDGGMVSVERSTDGVSYTRIGTGTDSYSDTGLSASTLYYYRVRGGRYSMVETATTNSNSALIAGWKFETNQVDYFQNTLADAGTLGVINFHSAIYYNGYTYIVYQGNDTDAYITTYRHSNGAWASPVKVGTNPLINADGHGAPAILIDNAGYIHCMFGAHVTTIQYFKSNNPENISAWTNMGNPCPTTDCTYPQLMQMSDDTIYLFYRKKAGDNNPDWGYVTSTNGGTSWSARTVVLQNGFAYGYFKKGMGDTIHCAAHKGTSQIDRKNVYYLFYNGANWINISNEIQSLPIDETGNNLLVYDSGDEWVPAISYSWDISNNPYLIFTEGHGATGVPDVVGTFTYRFLKHNGTSWVSYNIGATTSNWRNFATAIDVVSATVIDIYIVRNEAVGEIGGDIEKWSSINGGLSWNKISKIIRGRFLDPLIVKDYNVNAKLLITEYRATSTIWINRCYLWGNGGFLRNIAMTNTPDIVGKCDGLLVNTPTLTIGKYGNCFDFVGASSQRIVIDDNSKFSFNGGGSPDRPFTITHWIKIADSVTTQVIISKAISAGTREWQTLITANKIGIALLDLGGTNQINAYAPFVADNTFIFICYSYDGSAVETGLKVFINAVESQNAQAEVGTFTGLGDGTSPIHIACQAITSYKLTGLVDEVKIWNKVLSPTEMTNVMNNVAGW